MTLRGTIENGRLVLDDGESLPDGTRVDVHVRDKQGKSKARGDSFTRIVSRAVRTGVHDLAAEHDHYVYGTPKRATKQAPKRARAARKKVRGSSKTPKGRRR